MKARQLRPLKSAAEEAFPTPKTDRSVTAMGRGYFGL